LSFYDIAEGSSRGKFTSLLFLFCKHRQCTRHDHLLEKFSHFFRRIGEIVIMPPTDERKQAFKLKYRMRPSGKSYESAKI